MLVLALMGLAGCNGSGFGAFQTGVGSTPNRTPSTTFRILGDVGTRFTGFIADTRSTWPITGTIPLNVVVLNNDLPMKMTLTKQSSGHGILSIQLTVGYKVSQVASTSQPFGTVSLQTPSTAKGFSPPPAQANPDVRVFVKGPLGERFQGLVEDTQTAYDISDRSPVLFLFDQPVGKVDASFQQIQNLGPFVVDLIFNGEVVATTTGEPTVSIVQP